jgi:hypothetical protein
MVRNVLVAAAFVLFASIAVFGATVAPASVAFDGYDHSYEGMRTAETGGNVEAGY